MERKVGRKKYRREKNIKMKEKVKIKKELYKIKKLRWGKNCIEKNY